jgi:hypothetical protein
MWRLRGEVNEAFDERRAQVGASAFQQRSGGGL